MLVAICAIVIAVAVTAFWLTLGLLALDSGPIPRAYLLNLVCFASFIISAATLWKWPWIAAFVAWANMLSILTRFTPWNDDSAATFFSQFLFDHLFFVSANLGALAVLRIKRIQAQKPKMEPALPHSEF